MSGEDRIEEAARELTWAIDESEWRPILQRLFDDGKKAGSEYWKHKHDNLEKYVIQLREDYAKLRDQLADAEKDPQP